VTTANVKSSHSISASEFERSTLEVSSEAEIVQAAGEGANTTEISFGSFRLLPAQRLLLDGNKPVRLGVVRLTSSLRWLKDRTNSSAKNN
jgi:hypothetical protein